MPDIGPGAVSHEQLMIVSASGRDAPAVLTNELVRLGARRAVTRGVLLMSVRDCSNFVYIVQAGRLRATSFSAEGREVMMRDLVPGSLFGELAAVDGMPRSASVVAAVDSMVWAIDGASFRRIALQEPEAAAWLAEHLAALIRQMTDRLYEASLLSVRRRLLSHLARLCPRAGSDPNVAILSPAPTHEELAMQVGTHRETISRELRSLARSGIIRLARRRIDVLDVSRLARAAQEAEQ